MFICSKGELYQTQWQLIAIPSSDNNKCSFSAKRNLGIYFGFSVFTFFISENRLALFDFLFCNPNSDFGFYISQLRFSFRSSAF